MEIICDFKLGMQPITNVIVNNPIAKEFLIVKALWDTGSNITVIDKKVNDHVHLKCIGDHRPLIGIGGRDDNSQLLSGRITFPNGNNPQHIDELFQVHDFSKDPVKPNFDIIIGMNIISKGDLHIFPFQDGVRLIFKYPI